MSGCGALTRSARPPVGHWVSIRPMLSHRPTQPALGRHAGRVDRRTAVVSRPAPRVPRESRLGFDTAHALASAYSTGVGRHAGRVGAQRRIETHTPHERPLGFDMAALRRPTQPALWLLRSAFPRLRPFCVCQSPYAPRRAGPRSHRVSGPDVLRGSIPAPASPTDKPA